MKKTKNEVRLPDWITPITYDIKLHPDLENFTFSGVENITFKSTKPTNQITLHSKDIDIETAHIAISKTKKIFAEISYNEKNETATFTFPTKIKSGKNTLGLVFRGILNDKMRGFYKSSYVYEGKVNHLATTQFEATDARRAFPCFDEPAQKAVFNVSLVIPKGKTAISNTLPVERTPHESGFEVVRFAPTPKMSTYLLAFLVGEFEYLERKSKNGVLVRVYTTPGKKHQSEFALDTTVRVLDFYEDYFNIKYPLNTLDMIAIPDFTSLAMENWGAITFREIGLLVDEGKTSTASKELIAEVIAHELAHQWFGNLVTMEWWTHLWLNEGFASYIPYVVLHELFPEWDVWTRFTTETTNIAMRLDGLASTHPIEVAVHHPDEIGEIFDAVSYSKGASVIRMLADYLGPVKFRDGLRYYLKKHSYKNTSTVHLWEAFEKVSKQPVEKIMHNWTSQSGYPVVEVTQNKGELSFTQSRFFANPNSRVRSLVGEAKLKSKDNTVWQIPISANESKFLLTKKKETAALCSGMNEPIKVNLMETSFHRTVYSHELLTLLRNPVTEKTLSEPDRLGIIRDLFASSEAGMIPTNYALEFLDAYKNEDSYVVWSEIATGLGRLKQLAAKTKTEAPLNTFIINLFSPIFTKLGWEKKPGEKYTDTLLRPLVIGRLGSSGDKQIIKQAQFLFKNIEKGEQIDPDLRGVIYGLVAGNGGQKEFKTLTEMYKNEILHEEKNRIGYSLGNFKDEKILKHVAEFALSKNVRPQDTVGILSYVAINPIGRDVWVNILRDNWDTLVSRYGEGGHTLGRMLSAISNSSEKKHLEFFNKFFKNHPAPGAARAIEQTKEKIEGNMLWAKRDAKALDKFLNKK